MKILHITNNLWSGGVTTYLIGLLNYLSGNNKVTLLILGKDDEKYLKNKFVNVEIIFLNQKNIYSLKNLFKIRNIIKEYDIIHVHLFPAQYIVTLAGLFLKKFFIFTEHGTTNKRRNYKLFKWLEKYFVYSKYNKVICVSRASEINLKKWIGDKEKIISIPNGIDIEYYSKGKNIRKQIFEIKDDEKLISMVARFSSQKDYKTLVYAMTLLEKNVKCVFVGIGENLEEIKQLTKQLNLDDRIKFLGHRDDVRDILKSVDINILSTHYEGLPLIILESMAADTLILATDIDGNKEILSKELLFQKENYIELSKKINQLLYDNNLIQKEKIYIRKKIQDYSYERMFKNYLEVYKEQDKK